MKILQIAIENYKSISTLVLEPNGNNVKITGATGQGKTTAISALWDIFQMVGQPIKNGEKKGKIRVTLGDGQPEIIVERRFTAKTKQLIISDPEGNNKLSAPEFKELFCNLAVNPHKIMEQGPTEQLNTLLQTVTFPQGFNLQGVENSIESLSQDASDFGRDIKRMEVDLGVRPEEAQTVDLVVLYDEKNAIAKQNADVLKSKNLLISTHEKVKEISESMQKWVAYIADLENYLLNTKELDILSVETKIMNSEATNIKAQTFKTWSESLEKIEQTKTFQAQKIEAVKKLKAEKATALDQANWPVKGLKTENGKILYKNVPLSQLGNSEQMLICGALAATQIKEKDLKIVRMDGIESMSKEDFAQLSDIFNREGIQVLSSRVSRGDVELGEIVIENGKIVQTQGAV